VSECLPVANIKSVWSAFKRKSRSEFPKTEIHAAMSGYYSSSAMTNQAYETLGVPPHTVLAGETAGKPKRAGTARGDDPCVLRAACHSAVRRPNQTGKD